MDDNTGTTNQPLTTKKKWIIAGSVIGVLALGVLIWYIMTHVVHHSHSADHKAAHQSDIGGVHFNDLTPADTGPTNNSHIEVTGQDTRYDLGSKITVKWLNATPHAAKTLYWYLVGPSKKILIKNHPGNIAANVVIPEDTGFVGACKIVITDNYSKPTFSIHSSVFTTHIKLNFVSWNTTFYNKNPCRIGLTKDKNVDFSLYTITCYRDNKPFGQPIKATSVPLTAGNSGNLELEFTPQFTEAQVSCNLLVTAQRDAIIQTSGISSQTFTFKTKPSPSANKIILTNKSGGDTFHIGDKVIIAITLPDGVNAKWSDLTALSITDNNANTTTISPATTTSIIPGKHHPYTIYGTWELAIAVTATTFTMNATVTVSGTQYTADTVQSYSLDKGLLIDNVSDGYVLNYWDKNTLNNSMLPISLRTNFLCTLSDAVTSTQGTTWTLTLKGGSTVTRTIIDNLVINSINTAKTAALFNSSVDTKKYAVNFWLDNTTPISITGTMSMVLSCVINGVTYTSPSVNITLTSLKSYENITSTITSLSPTTTDFPHSAGPLGADIYMEENESGVLPCHKISGFHTAMFFQFDSFDGDTVKGWINAPGIGYLDYLDNEPRYLTRNTTNNSKNLTIITNTTSGSKPSVKINFNNDYFLTAIGLVAKNSEVHLLPQLKNTTFMSLVLSDYFYYKISGTYDYWFTNVNYFKNPCTCALQGVCTQ